MSIRVSPVFVTRFHEALALADRTSVGEGYGADQRRVEMFLDIMKYDLAAVLLADGAGAVDISQKVENNS